MKVQLFHLVLFLALTAVSVAQQDKEDKDAVPQDDAPVGNEVCPPLADIVDGQPCGDFIPAGSQEASCFNAEGLQCNCAGQDNPDPNWQCRSVGIDVVPTASPTAAPVAVVDTPPPTPIATLGNTTAPTVAPVDLPTEAPVDLPTEAPVDLPTEAPVDQPTEAPVEPPPTGSPVAPVNCVGQICDPGLSEQCNCRPGLQCRQRQPGEYRCSQLPRNERTRLSGGLGIGGAAGRDRRNRMGFLAF